MKTAYTLYRVSTGQQVDKVKNDIPLQREACREFAQKMGWQIGKEFYERGVSGFKLSADERDAIQELKEAALNHEFDILLVFMFDRIGRIDNETPFVVEWFAGHGIRVWSVQEGEQRFDSHVDKLMNYIRFWQASGESEKSSMRIRTRMKQLREEGCYTGGHVPYGYQLVDTGMLTKKGRVIHRLEIDPVTSEWVRDIFSLTVNVGYGSFRCASYLNDKGRRTHNGTKFQSNTIIRILRNRMYCGHTSNSEEAPRREDLRIIDDTTFNRAQEILDRRVRKNEDRRTTACNTKSALLLSGLLLCGHCDGHLTPITHVDKHIRKDGSVYRKSKPRYLCYHNSRKLCEYDGQVSYLADRLDKMVLDVMSSIFDSAAELPDEAELKKQTQRESQCIKANITKLNLELSRMESQLDKLMSEVAPSLMGESSYTPEVLNRLINEQEEKIAGHHERIEELEKQKVIAKSAVKSLHQMYETIRSWADEFDSCTLERKKMIISQLFDSIEVRRGYELYIRVNESYRLLLEKCCRIEVENVVVGFQNA